MDGECILIVEDSKFQGIIIKDILMKNGYKVKWVLSAEEAMELNIYENYDLVLLDVILPGINGYEFCEIIKRNNSLLPVIILTSIEDEKYVVKALDSGADDYIKKPYSVDELLARIKVQLRTRKLQLELIEKNAELQKAYNIIKKMSVTDMLTGAYNRAYIKEYLDNIIKYIDGDKFEVGCIMIDIDNFKKVNDTYGHLTGDAVLKNVAQICTNNIKDCGAVIRFGGEEFLLIITKEIERLSSISESIRYDCEKSMYCGFKYTVSLGCCEFTIHKETLLEDFEEGVKEADRMLYISKNKGKNRVTIKQTHTA